MIARQSIDDRLRQLSRQVLDGHCLTHSCEPALCSLVKLLRECATVRVDPSRVSVDGETHMTCGLALSPTMAGRCADDLARTVVFLRGLHDSIAALACAAPHRPIRVLYAGCGPYALLAIPAMAMLGSDVVRFTLLDIHAPSVASANAVVETFGLGPCIDEYALVDACRYRVPADRSPDIILTETMNACLSKEPQVAITLHLHREAPAAVWVPKAIRVDAFLVDPTVEFAFVNPPTHQVPLDREQDRIFLGTVFELSVESAASWSNAGEERLPASPIRIPRTLERRYTPMLFTTVTVSDTQILGPYDSGLTIPQHLPFDGSLQGGEVLGFHYRLGEHPGLVCDGVVA